VTNPWEQLLEVQGLDTTLDQLDHRLRSLPERHALEEVRVQKAELADQIEARQRRRADLVRSQRRLEDEIASFGTKRDHSHALLYGGTVNSPKELNALQGEITGIDRRVGALEDEILQIMELLEPVDNDLAALAAQDAALDAQLAELQRSLDDAERDIRSEHDATTAARAEVVGGVDAGLVGQYEKARHNLGGVAVARLIGSRCDGCHLGLSAVEIDRIKHLPLDEPVTCEECGRFLVR
jgi:predicted  nucleic acid-binding Zn-ribbon protein